MKRFWGGLGDEKIHQTIWVHSNRFESIRIRSNPLESNRIYSKPFESIRILSHYHTITISHYHTRTVSHYHSITLSHYHSITLSHYHGITTTHYHKAPVIYTIFEILYLTGAAISRIGSGDVATPAITRHTISPPAKYEILKFYILRRPKKELL